MADLGAVEIPLVVRQQGLRESLNTVNRLEAEIRRAVAAANAQQISQERLNKTLLAAKREYQQLGVSSQKATAEIRKFAAAAQMQQTAMMGSTKGMNSMGVGMQQLGYQVGDFLVQVQSGTNALVAFGQQATQVVGFLPMMTKSFMGLSGTALVAFSAALGIIIPLVTALGAAFMRTREASDAATSGFVGVRQAMEDARAETAQMADEIERLNRGLESNAELNLVRAIEEQTKIVDQRREALEQIYQTELDGVVVAEQRLQNEQETLDELVHQLETLRLTSDELETVKEETEEAERAARGMADELERAARAVMNINTAAFNKLQELEAELRGRSRGLTDAQIRIQQAAIRAEREARAAGVDSSAELANIAAEAAEIERQIIAAEQGLEQFNETGTSGTSKVTEEVEKLANELDGPLNSAINGVSNAWAEFVMRGFQDFSSFADAVLNSFKNMLAQMISMAARNEIMFNMGMSGGGGGSSILGGIGGGGGGLLSNVISGGRLLLGLGGGFTGSFGAGLAATLTGGLSGGMGAFSTGLSMIGGGVGSGGLAGAISGLQMAAGAALPVIGAVAAAVSFFRSKTKLLDSGIQGTVRNMDALLETFQVIEKSRFWGLSKKTSTNLEEMSSEEAEPFLNAIKEIQQSVLDAANVFGIAGDTFDNFIYKFRLSLKGLSEEEKMQKINEELLRMGDAFASLTGHFETMNELLEAANQRMELQNRLDQLLGNNAAILARQREAELKAMHEINRPLARAIYQLEDAQAAVGKAFAALRASIDAEKNRLRDSFASIVEGLRERLDVANDALNRSRNIYQMLESALSGRFVSSGIRSMFSRREGALNFLRGGNFEDEKTLRDALDVVGQPTEDLYSSFVDYARDFYTTSNIIEEAKDIAEVQLTADQQQVLLLEQQIAQAASDLDQQLTALDEQLAAMERQYNALMGIDDSVKSVEEAIGTLRVAIEKLAEAQKAAQSLGAVGGGGAASNVQKANQGGQDLIQKFGLSGVATRESDQAQFQKIDLRGRDQLLQAAASLGVETSGKTGAQIQQDISNAGYIGVSLDNATRAQQFAMGGFHRGGLRLVGERGPELEATGASRIFSHNQTAGMFRDPELKDAVRSLKEEVAGLRSEQRQIQMNIAKYTKRNYDLERKWDVDGLPATRT